MTKNYSFNTFHHFADENIFQSLIECNQEGNKPIFVCIGSDLVLGDSLGPLVGTLLKKRNLSSYVYGTLNSPITAKEIEYVKTYLKQMHPNTTLVAIDAAIGPNDEIGLIKVSDKGLAPGLGVNKKLGVVGDISIIGIVASSSVKNYNLYNLTRLNLVFKMAEKIVDGIEKYINFLNEQTFKQDKIS